MTTQPTALDVMTTRMFATTPCRGLSLSRQHVPNLVEVSLIKRWSISVLIVVTILSGGCRRTDLQPSEGYVNVQGGRIWYRIAGSGTRTPLLLLHGGPGAPSYYLNPLAALADERPVIFYDQLGAGRSDKPTDVTLWRVERFVEELRRLRTALSLDQVHLLGHSWGTMLAVDYMLTKPVGVRSLILASPALSISRWIQDAETLKRTLPESVQAVIAKHESAGTFDSPEYQAAMITTSGTFVVVIRC